jgi:LysM repeat protein
MRQFSFLRAALFLGYGVLVSACANNPAPVAAVTPASTTPPAGHAYLVVDRGQSLDKIAQTYHVAKRDLIAANHLTPPFGLKPGMVLEIPAPTMKSVAKAKERPEDGGAVEAGAKPVRTGAVAGPARSAKPKPSEPEVIPLD